MIEDGPLPAQLRQEGRGITGVPVEGQMVRPEGVNDYNDHMSGLSRLPGPFKATGRKKKESDEGYPAEYGHPDRFGIESARQVYDLLFFREGGRVPEVSPNGRFLQNFSDFPGTCDTLTHSGLCVKVGDNG